jgi:hypothetical protein
MQFGASRINTMAKRIHIRIRYGPRSRSGILLAALVLVGFFLGVLIIQTQSTQAAKLEVEGATSSRPMRQFYVTKNNIPADQALTACAPGYHMASLWEIYDPSNLKYNTTLGDTSDDSGLGPPVASAVGWVRTGWSADTGTTAGKANCNAWTSASNSDWGTYIYLEDDWNSISEIDPWYATKGLCSNTLRVWCVEDQVYHQVFLPQVVRE